jgi:osmotically-inducible protein OsmY
VVNERLAILDTVRARLRSDPRVGIGKHRVGIGWDAGVLTLEGEVGDVAAKKRALIAAATVPGVDEIVDRLHVAPAERMGDGQVRDLLRDALLQEPAFDEFAIRERTGGKSVPVRTSPKDVRGNIEIEVRDGVVTLNGAVPGLDGKRLAGVLAWWVPGSRDVINGIAVEPAEIDGDEAIAEAVRLALEKDPFVNASQLRVAVHHAVVTLSGLLPTESQRDMAESDAWYIFGVNGVTNRIEVEP